MNDLGDSIKYFRKIKGLSQEDLAAKIGKSVSSVRKYEQAVVLPSTEVLQAIASALDVSFEKLVSNEPNSSDIHLLVDQFESKILPLLNDAALLDGKVNEKNGYDPLDHSADQVPDYQVNRFAAYALASSGIDEIASHISTALDLAKHGKDAYTE